MTEEVGLEELNHLLRSVDPDTTLEDGGTETTRKRRDEKRQKKKKDKKHKRRRRDGSAEEAPRRGSKYVVDAAESTSGEDSFVTDGEEEEGWDAIPQYEAQRHLFYPGDEEKDGETLGREYEDRIRAFRAQRGAAAEMGVARGVPRQVTSSMRYTSQMLPQESDPKVFAVKCKPRMARLLVGRIINKCYYYRIGKNLPMKADLGILSVFSLDHIKEYIYVEAHRQYFVAKALEGLVGVFRFNITEVKPEQLIHMLEHRPENENVHVGTLVRLRQRPYRGDLAEVTSVLSDGKHIQVMVVPREDFVGKTFSKATEKLPQKFFVPSLALEAEDRGDHIRWGDLKFNRDGYLLRTVSIRSVMSGENMQPSPTTQELAFFYNHNREKVRVAVARYSTDGLKEQRSIRIGDTVRVVTGELRNTVGTVANLFVNSGVALLSCKVPNRREPVSLRVELSECTKDFPVGTHVVVEEGEHRGMSGTVVKSYGEVVTLFCDRANITPEITIKANECYQSKLIGSVSQRQATNSVASRWSLYDLVSFSDSRAVGCIVLFHHNAVDVLTEDNERRTVSHAQIKPMARGAKKTLDAFQNVLERGAEVSVKDTEQTPFRLAGQSGKIEQVCKDRVFVSFRSRRENAGLVALPAQCVLLRGGRTTTRAVTSTTRTLPAPIRRPHNAEMAEHLRELEPEPWNHSSEYVEDSTSY